MTANAATPKTANTRVQAIFDDVLTALVAVLTKHKVSYEEYRVATAWLTRAGQEPYEIPLLLDVFLSSTIDDYLNVAEKGSTESNVEGPFYVPSAPSLEEPYVLPRRNDEPGEPLVFSGTVKATDGSPLAGATLDVWQANGAGEYSHFHPGVPDYNLRGHLRTDAQGRFEFETVLPVPYEIPKAGATGQLLNALGRHAFRPAHVHFKVTHKDARPLTTQIYFESDPWIDSDVVGAVKQPLITSLTRHAGNGRDSWLACSYDFVLVRVH
jgi:catechol 1,2-dioxygenase